MTVQFSYLTIKSDFGSTVPKKIRDLISGISFIDSKELSVRIKIQNITLFKIRSG